MSKVKVKVDLYPGAIRRLQEIVQQAFEMTAAEVLTDVRDSQTIPHNIGTLEGSGHVDDREIKSLIAHIVFDTPYARRLYWHPEYNFRQDKNQFAGGLWMQTYLDGEKRKYVKETFSAFLKQLGGTLIK